MSKSKKKKSTESYDSVDQKTKKTTKKDTDKSKKAKTDEKWLENELDDVDLETDNEIDSEDLMKKAAEQLQSFQKDIKEWKDKYLRLHAEWDTYRRRLKEQRQQEKAVATESLVKDILPVLDDFERSIKYANENGEEGLLSGVEAVYSKLNDVLAKNGVKVINPKKDEAFDALNHQAVSTVEDKESYDESVAFTMQKGYQMGKKVIRPAMVSVTTGGEKRPKETDDDNEIKDED